MKSRLFEPTALVAVLCVATLCSAADDVVLTGYDKAWGYLTLYKNKDNFLIQKFALSGRAQVDAAWFDADQGEFDDINWRRFRFGFRTDLFQDWVVHLEGDFDLNGQIDEWDDGYDRLTDAYIGWSPMENLTFKILKQSAGFTLDGATSSKKLLTMQRNNITNNLWFTKEYFTGLLTKGTFGKNGNYKAGIFSSDPNEEMSQFEAGYFILLALGYKLASGPQIRIDYVYQDEDENANTKDFSNVVSLASQYNKGAWGLWTDLSMGDGCFEQSDVWGVSLMPFYDLTKHIQTVLRYTYLSSQGDNGVTLNRYENRIVEGEGDEYNEIYAGLNIFFYDHKFKWQTGVQYTTMNDDANDGGEYDGWGLSTGLRISW